MSVCVQSAGKNKLMLVHPLKDFDGYEYYVILDSLLLLRKTFANTTAVSSSSHFRVRDADDTETDAIYSGRLYSLHGLFCRQFKAHYVCT